MVSKNIFIDTSGWFALLVSNDAHHKKATALLDPKNLKQTRFVTSDYIIDETTTLLISRKVAQQTQKLFDIIDNSQLVNIEWIAHERFTTARRFLLKNIEHEYSFTDCTSFVLMKELRIKAALTADRHFSKAGFVCLL